MALTTLLALPFNGSAESSGTNPVTLNVKDGSFVAGRITNQALDFPTTGYAQGMTQPFPLSGTFTLTFWVKARPQPFGPTASWILFRFSGADQFLYLDLSSTLTAWSYITIIQQADRVSVVVNGRQTASEVFPAGWGKPVGFAVVNDGAESSGYLSMEEVTLYAGVQTDLPAPTPTPVKPTIVAYSINGLAFKNYGVYVAASSGLLDNLTMKDPARYEWPDYHGEVIDLSRPLYQPRIITLSCFMLAPTADAFIEQLNLFLAQFTQAATQRLRVMAHSTKPLVYEVYLRDSINLKKRWSPTDMTGTFELNLIEAEPVKRVLSFGAGTASITLTSSTVVSIHWGDRTHTYDVFGTAKTVTHTYATPGPHEIIIAGMLEDITQFSSNAPVLWSRL